MKLGGDKGRGSFKFAMQLVNTTHPNSPSNTSIIAIFKAGYSRANLWEALNQYRMPIEEIQEAMEGSALLQWRL